MIEVYLGDIVDIKSDLLVNASNKVGWMGGTLGSVIKMSGVAESIHYTYKGVEKEAKKYCKKYKPNLGDVFLTKTSYSDKELLVAHAVTVKYPGWKSNLGVVDRCLQILMHVVEELGVQTVTLPLLGTGTGSMDAKEVIILYKKYLEHSEVLFKLVCYDKEIYDYVEELEWVQVGKT